MSSGAPELERLQRWMLSVISNPGGAQAGLGSEEAHNALTVEPAALESVVLPSKELSSVERLAVYASAYFQRLIEVLDGVFPTVRHVLGQEKFEQVCTAFLHQHPSTHFSLSKLGEPFHGWLREEAGDEVVPHLAFLADVASIEWAMDEVFDEKRAEPIEVETLQAIPPEEFASKALRPIPACRLLALDYPANAYIQAVRDDRHMDLPEPEPSWVLVYRRDYRSWRVELDLERYTLLDALARGRNLGEAIEACASLPEVDVDRVTSCLGDWFREWAGVGLFCAIE